VKNRSSRWLFAEFRSFEEWNSDSDVAGAAKRLYIQMDDMDLYVSVFSPGNVVDLIFKTDRLIRRKRHIRWPLHWLDYGTVLRRDYDLPLNP
jgi:hypothetical protein